MLDLESTYQGREKSMDSVASVLQQYLNSKKPDHLIDEFFISMADDVKFTPFHP
jgi:hypothetical protein